MSTGTVCVDEHTLDLIKKVPSPHSIEHSINVMETLIRTVIVYTRVANEKFHLSMPDPVIDFGLAFDAKTAKVAGQFIHDGIGTYRFNHVLCEDFPIEQLNETAVHEVAHKVVKTVFLDKGVMVKPHGAEWRETMRQLGSIPAKYHQMDTTRAKAFSRQLKAALKKEEAERRKRQKAAEKLLGG